MKLPMQPADILLPASHISYEKWAVVACDQFTSQPDYWREAEALVGDSPSTLRLTLPEIWLNESARRVPEIQRSMADYLNGGVLQQAVHGFILVERTTPSGIRPGLVAALDLEAYDFSAGSSSLIRATEGTVPERVPPRARIRRDASLELPHVMMLIDDPMKRVIEPLWERRSDLRCLYDFDLMLGGGHLRGWAVEGTDAEAVLSAMQSLYLGCNGLLFAVGDGTNSLAAARQCWLEIRSRLTEAERETHPARYALTEIVNLNCEAMQFEPIHRVLFNVNSAAFISEFRAAMRSAQMEDAPGDDLVLFDPCASMSFKFAQHPLPFLQSFLDSYLSRHPETDLDYIHGDEALRQIVSSHTGCMGFKIRSFDKSELFGAIRRWGALPRKTFSMGEATEKRYYMEARRIKP